MALTVGSRLGHYDVTALFIAYVPTGARGSVSELHCTQLYDLQTGVRNGAWSDLMDATVADLTIEDIVNIAAYVASIEP